MRSLVRLLAVLMILVSSLVWGQSQAQALNLSAVTLPSTSVVAARLNAVDSKLTTEFGQKIDLNNSDIRDFRDLRGFYPNLAGKIIKNAPYDKVEDVLDISGLSDTQKERLQANIDRFVVTEPSKELIEGDDRFNPGVY